MPAPPDPAPPDPAPPDRYDRIVVPVLGPTAVAVVVVSGVLAMPLGTGTLAAWAAWTWVSLCLAVFLVGWWPVLREPCWPIPRRAKRATVAALTGYLGALLVFTLVRPLG